MVKQLQLRQVSRTFVGSLVACFGLLVLLAAVASFSNLDAGIRLVPVARILACAAGGVLCRTGSKLSSALNAGLGGLGVVLVSFLLALAFGGVDFGFTNVFDAISVIAAASLGGLIRP